MSCDKNDASANELFRWEIDSTGGVVIVALLDDKASSVDVPAQIDGKPVVEIGPGAFSLRRALTKISLPDGVRKLGSNAFSQCRALRAVALPPGLRTLPANAFDRCSSLTQVSFPKGLQTLGDRAFTECSSLVEISLPDGLQTLGFMPFAFCSPNLTLYGAAGSVAEECARENGIRFEPR